MHAISKRPAAAPPAVKPAVSLSRLRKLQHASLASAVEARAAADEARAVDGLYQPPYQIAER